MTVRHWRRVHVIFQFLVICMWTARTTGSCENIRRRQWRQQRSVVLASELSLTQAQWPIANGNIAKVGDTCNVAALPDECVSRSIAVGFVKIGGSPVPYVMSDLSRALKCVSNATGDGCACAETGASPVPVGTETLCVKPTFGASERQATSADECIHAVECPSKKNCIFHPNQPKDRGDCGDIEDLRRFCAGAKHLHHSVPLCVFSVVLTTFMYLK